jgi:hypothetical protein
VKVGVVRVEVRFRLIPGVEVVEREAVKIEG